MYPTRLGRSQVGHGQRSRVRVPASNPLPCCRTQKKCSLMVGDRKFLGKPCLVEKWYPRYRVCVFSSHSFWTSSSLNVSAGVTQEEGHTGFFIHLLSAVRAFIFLARRIQPFLSLVNREVEFCVLMI